jgi:hypothetical protein
VRERSGNCAHYFADRASVRVISDAHFIFFFLCEMQQTCHNMQYITPILATFGMPIQQNILHNRSINDILLIGLQPMNGFI